MPPEPSKFDEKRLLALATQGDKEAFGYLYEHYVNEVYRYVYYRIGDQHEAEDITANVFVKTWEYLPKINQQDSNIRNFRNWLYQVAKNLIIDFYRVKKPVRITDELAGDEASLERAIGQNSQSEYLAKAILALRHDFQQIIILRFINELSHNEVAEIMELSTGQTRILQYRALKKLREMITSDST